MRGVDSVEEKLLLIIFQYLFSIPKERTLIVVVKALRKIAFLLIKLFLDTIRAKITLDMLTILNDFLAFSDFCRT